MKRREFVTTTVAGLGAGAALRAVEAIAADRGTQAIRFGYAAITWGGNDRQAIADVAALGFPGIQLRSNILPEFGGQPAALKELLQAHKLTMVALSSGGVSVTAPAEEEIAKHARHAAFVRDVGGLYLQVTDQLPPGRAATAADRQTLGRLMTEIGKRGAAVGIPLGYHNHMNSLGERPAEVDEILAAADPRYVGFELDIAHYLQGGGDPVQAIERHAGRLLFLHIKDVEPVSPAPGVDAGRPYRFVELGRGRVDLPGVFAALKKAGFKGWAVVELDAVPDKARSPKESGQISKSYLGKLGFRVEEGSRADAKAPEVKVVPDEAGRRVDVTVDGKPFTAYVWPDTLKKPVLYPVRTARGTLVTRGFPLDPRPGERVDHPHHVGLWFNYGDVDGIDYWNNSDAVKAEDRPRMGNIRHRRIVSAKGGKDRGELVVDSDWVRPGGTAAIRERTQYVFGAGPDWRSVDRITTLTAGDKPVVFNDNKEGVLGMRMARGLEQPSKTPEVFTDAQGRATTVPVLNNEGVTGVYLSSEGKKGDDVWGTRGRWVALSGAVEGEPVTILMLDHPRNPGFPTYWHARGYGLFAANPLGQKVFSNGKEELKHTLPAGGSTTFRHRIVIASGPLSAAQAEQRYREFVSTVP